MWAPREWERSLCVSLTSADERGSPDIVSESQQLKVRCQEDEPAFSHLHPTRWGSGASAHVTSSEKRLPVTPCSREPVTAVLVSLVPGLWRRTCFVGPQSPACRHRPPGSLLRLTALLLTLPVRPGGPSVTTRARQRQAAPAHAFPAAALLAQQAHPCAAGPPHTPPKTHRPLSWVAGGSAVAKSTCSPSQLHPELRDLETSPAPPVPERAVCGVEVVGGPASAAS